jgi:Ca-activated chloride channel family protein
VDPLSTFALDVDTASYGYAQRTLVDGGLPDPSTVRPEEFVNSFAQDYAQPDGNGFSISADGVRMTVGGDSSHHVVRVGLQTRAADAAERPDAQLTFVIDVSGSMGEPGKLDLVQQALHTLVAALRPTDAVGIVTFSDEAHVVRQLSPLRDKRAVDEAIDGLRVDASTNLQAGLESGYQIARAGYRAGKTNRVILLSDGLANTGETDVNRLVNEVRESAGNGIALLGVGVGSDYGDALMEKLADKGNGFTSYVSSVDAARKLFVDRLPSTLAVRARDAKAQIVFDPRTVASYRLIGYEDRAINDGDFRNDRVDGGEVGPGHSVTALYDVRLWPGVEGHVGDAQVHWVDPTDGTPHDGSIGIDTANIDRGLAQVSPRLVVDVAAASLALTLGNTGTDGNRDGLTTWPTLDALAAQLDDAARSLDNRDVFGLVDLVRIARSRMG